MTIKKYFKVKKDYDSTDLAHFAQTIMKGCDTNRDGKISKKVFLFNLKINLLFLNLLPLSLPHSKEYASAK